MTDRGRSGRSRVGIARQRGRSLVVHRALEDEAMRAAAAESSGEKALKF
jgi:hypothetical protein